MTLYLGSVVGGPEDIPAETLFGEISALIIAHRDKTPISTKAGLNIVFHFPGSICPVTFKGIRTAKFSRKQKLLMVQVAVPEEVAASNNADAFTLDSIREAIRLAKPIFEKAAIDFPMEDQLAFVDQIEAEVRRLRQ